MLGIKRAAKSYEAMCLELKEKIIFTNAVVSDRAMSKSKLLFGQMIH